MNTYNYELYSKRNELGLSRRKMAKKVGIWWTRYAFIENGYVKPSAKEVTKISEALGFDFSVYMGGAASNPCDLPNKKEMAIVRWFYELVGKLWMRIVLGVLAALSCLFLTSGFIVSDWTDNHGLEFYDENYKSLVEEISASSDMKLSILGDFASPAIAESLTEENGHSKLIMVYNKTDGGTQGKISFELTYRTDAYRLIYTIATYGMEENGAFLMDTTLVYYDDNSKFSNTFFMDSNGDLMLAQLNETDNYPGLTAERYADMTSRINSYKDDIGCLYSNRIKTNITFQETIQEQAKGDQRIFGYVVYGAVAVVFGIVLSGIFVFAFFFALLYGRKKGQAAPFTRSYVAVVQPPPKDKDPLKKDVRFGPVIPETVMVLLGTILVFAGTFRIAIFVGGFFGGSLGGVLASGTTDRYLSTFIIGMFLLYFIDFDTFVEDSRVIWRIVMYAVIFFALYALEVIIMDSLEAASILGTFTNKIPVPNMFSSIACYFIITYCLFFTPKWAKKHKALLVLHRLLAILPIAWIFISWYIYKGNGVFHNLDWPRSIRYLFNGERLPFSILAVTYLVGYYLIRLYYEKKYGEVNANVFFNSNRFLWIKNTYVSIVILVIGICELILMNNSYAHKLELGYYWGILILIPFVFFYREHQGPRNAVFDFIVSALYFLILAVAYLIILAVGVVGLATNLIGV